MDPVLLANNVKHTIAPMDQDRLERLRRLGVVKGTRNLKPAASRAEREVDRRLTLPQTSAASDSDDEIVQPLEVLLPGGQIVKTEFGSCFVLDRIYPLSHLHGDSHLLDIAKNTLPAAAAIFCQDHRLAEIEFDDFLFLDTETTGLIGAGTIAFMVGVAYFDKDAAGQQAFIVRQYFLRDHGDEPAMLLLLSELLSQRSGLVTFNGRAFDLPLLDTRYLMNRLDGLIGDLLDRPHIDLLPPSRRLWRNRLVSCSLSSLEQHLLGLQRSHEDVPGWLIPGLYLDYLRTGDARQLLRVFYHNRIDMLSMVTLAGRIFRQFAQPGPDDHPLDLLSLAKWQTGLGLTDAAEQNLRLVAALDPPLDIYQQALAQLGMILKRDGRRNEAAEIWQKSAVTSLDDVTAHIELAKHFEWHDQDLETAREWTQAAITLLSKQGAHDPNVLREELQHRLARLERKIAADEGE